MNRDVTTADGLRATLTTEHATSSYGRPVVVIDGQAYGPGDWFNGRPILLRRPHDDDGLSATIDQWNREAVSCEA